MSVASNYSNNHFRTQLGFTECRGGMTASLRSVFGKVFESAEKAAAIAVIALVLSLVTIAFMTLEEFSTVTAQYCDAIPKVVYSP